MRKDLRVVIDTNVLVSGLFGIKNSPSSQILQAIRSQKIILVTSLLILDEIADVIGRPRIIRYTKMSQNEQKQFIDELILRSEVIKGLSLPQPVSRDVKDDKFLSCAYESKVDYLVTGDEDLLVLKVYQDIKIINPRDFLPYIG